MRFYTGIGSRETPDDILREMRVIAAAMRKKLYTLRSGGADGADTAFEIGADGHHNIYLPWKGFNGRLSEADYVDSSTLFNFDRAKYIASMHHPAWENLKDSAKALHGRNVFQVLGFTLEHPSDAVIFYAEPTRNGQVKGGTNTAVQVAKQYKIPTYNLYLHQDLMSVKKLLRID